MSIKKLYNPEFFQGKLDNKDYFEGWFYKLESCDSKDVMAVIVGIATAKDDPHAFIQVNYQGESEFFRFNINEFGYERDSLWVRLRGNIFTDKYMRLDLVGKKLRIKGMLHFKDRIPYPKSLVRPGIMGAFSYISFMECYHGVVNIKHRIIGSLMINGEEINFSCGNGYIEKDWGTSFPKRYLWLQCGNFKGSDASLMLAIADIPFLGYEFTGIIGYLYMDGEYHNLATYNGAYIKRMDIGDDEIFLVVKNLKYSFYIRARVGEVGAPLRAPANGKMDREIKESLSGDISLIVAKNKETILKTRGSTASMEICGY